MWIKNVLEKCRRNRFERRKLIAESESKELFQIREHEGQTWVTFNGNLVCPSEWLGEDVILRLFEMRRYYIDRELRRLFGENVPDV